MKISFHKHNLKPNLVHYIYPKIHKKSKRQALEKGFALIEKTISHEIYGRDMYTFIADI
jgi:hypothetical protein